MEIQQEINTNETEMIATANAVNILIEELRHDDIKNRLNAMKQVHIIAQAIGPKRTREELIPYLSEYFEDDEDVLITKANLFNHSFIPSIGGEIYLNDTIIPLLETLAKHEGKNIRMAAIESINNLVEFLSKNEGINIFYPLFERLATNNAHAGRLSAAGIISILYKKIININDNSGDSDSNTANKDNMINLFIKLCKDSLAIVRKTSCIHFPDLLKNVKEQEIQMKLFDVFLSIINEDQDHVKLYLIDIFIEFISILNWDKIHETELLTKHLLCLSNDKSWRVRWTVANKIHLIYQTLCNNKNKLNKDNDTNNNNNINIINDMYLILLNDTEPEVRTIGINRLGESFRFINNLDNINYVIKFLILLKNNILCDKIIHVRAALATVLMKITVSFTSANNNNIDKGNNKQLVIEYLVPIFLQLLHDEQAEVRLNVLTNLQGKYDNEEETNKLDHINYNQSHIVLELDTLKESLVPAVLLLANDRQWRVRLAIIEYVPFLANQMGPLFFEKHFLLLIFDWLGDRVFSIREAATEDLLKLHDIFGTEWTKKMILPNLAIINKKTNYLFRITSLHAIQALAQKMSPDTISDQLLPLVLELSDDPVPNIRFNVAKTLQILVSLLSVSESVPIVSNKIIDSHSIIHSKIKPILYRLQQDIDNDVKYYADKALKAF